MAKNLDPKHEEIEEDWLITYADAITLLMAFFVMILSFSKISVSTFQEVQAAIAQEMGRHEVPQTINLLSFKLEDAVYQFEMENAVTVDVTDDGVIMEFASSALYLSGSATIKNEAKPLLEGMVGTMNLPSYKEYYIEIEGHTDDAPISTARFPSNWELSAARAINIARFMIAKGVGKSRFRIAGYADVQPKVPNRDVDGKPLLENRAKNRRIVVRLFLADT